MYLNVTIFQQTNLFVIDKMVVQSKIEIFHSSPTYQFFFISLFMILKKPSTKVSHFILGGNMLFFIF